MKREAKAVTEAELEALDGWFDLEDDFELLSFKAWNAVIYQVHSYCILLAFLSFLAFTRLLAKSIGLVVWSCP